MAMTIFFPSLPPPPEIITVPHIIFVALIVITIVLSIIEIVLRIIIVLTLSYLLISP